MTTFHRNDRQDKKALLIGTTLVLFVGVYFIGRSFFWKNQDVSLPPVGPAVVDNNKETIALIAPDVLSKKIQSGEKVALVDIRTESAFGAEHIAHSLSVPIGSLQNFSPEKDESVVIVYSVVDEDLFETAKNLLAQKSFPYFFLKGGIEGWKGISAPLVSGGDPKSFLDQSKVTSIGPDVLKKMQSEKTPLFILDVQSGEDYKKKHLVGAVNIPLTELEKRSGEIPAGQQIVVYGENDMVSFQGGVRLSDLGIFTARTLSGNKYLSSDSGLSLEP